MFDFLFSLQYYKFIRSMVILAVVPQKEADPVIVFPILTLIL